MTMWHDMHGSAHAKNILFRPLEATVAGYAALVGIMFLWVPDALTAPVYDPWDDLGRNVWGIGILIVALLHFGALYANGGIPQWSRPVRLWAVGMHLGLCYQFALNFLESGALWGVITYGMFVPTILVLIGSRVMRRFLHGGTTYEL